MGWIDSLHIRNIRAGILMGNVDYALDEYTAISDKTAAQHFISSIDIAIQNCNYVTTLNGIAEYPQLSDTYKKQNTDNMYSKRNARSHAKVLDNLTHFPDLVHFRVISNIKNDIAVDAGIPLNLQQDYFTKEPQTKNVIFEKTKLRSNLIETFRSAANNTNLTTQARDFANHGFLRLQYGNFLGTIFFKLGKAGDFLRSGFGIPAIFANNSISEDAAVPPTASSSKPAPVAANPTKPASRATKNTPPYRRPSSSTSSASSSTVTSLNSERDCQDLRGTPNPAFTGKMPLSQPHTQEELSLH